MPSFISTLKPVNTPNNTFAGTLKPVSAVPHMPPQQKPGVVERVGNSVDSVMRPASDFLFGTTGKTVGSMITDTIGQGAKLYGQISGNKNASDLGGKLEKQADVTNNITPTNIAFTALELYPGGGELTKSLKALPGGERIAEVISKLPENLKKSAVEQYSKIFNATSKESKALVKEVVPGMLDKGIKFSSAGKLADQAEKQATTYGEAIDKYFADLPATAKEKTKPILDKLAEERNKYVVEGKVMNENAVNAFNGVMSKIAQFGDRISTESVRKIRQIFDEHFDVTKGLDDITTYVKKAERAGADAIRAEFAKSRPDLAKINKEFNFWNNVKELATYSSEKAKAGAVKRGIFSTLGAAAGFESGQSSHQGLAGSLGMGVIGAMLGERALEFMGSPAWKSVAAVNKSKIADALMKGDKKTLELIFSKVLTSGKNLLDSK